MLCHIRATLRHHQGRIISEILPFIILWYLLIYHVIIIVFFRVTKVDISTFQVRMQNQTGGALYKGTTDCVVKTVKNEVSSHFILFSSCILSCSFKNACFSSLRFTNHV